MTIPAALPPIPSQWSAKGASVRKGGTPVIWFKMLGRKDADETGTDEDGRQIPCARLSWVFNVGQADGYQSEKARTTYDNQVFPIAQADALIAASLATHQGEQACYRPSTDEIVLLLQHLFTGTSTSSATEA